MPASIAHMLISRKVREQLSSVQEYNNFGTILSDHQVYMELGALGPDLPYYESTLKAGVKLLLTGLISPWGLINGRTNCIQKHPTSSP